MGIPIVFYLDTMTTDELLTRTLDAIRPVKLAMFLEEDAHNVIQDSLDKRFKSEGDAAVGGPWAPLREATERFREHAGFGAAHPINRRTGDLQSWLESDRPSVTTATGGASYEFPGGAMPAGSLDMEKLQTAQKGKADPATVARPVLAITDSDALAITMLLSEFIVDVQNGIIT